MRACIIDTFGQPPRLGEAPDPVCPAHGAVVEVHATGVCRSDWHAWQGHDDSVRLPHVPGHEFAGVIAQVGQEVTGFRAGDRVTAPFIFACAAASSAWPAPHRCAPTSASPGSTCPVPGPSRWWSTRPTTTWWPFPTRST